MILIIQIKEMKNKNKALKFQVYPVHKKVTLKIKPFLTNSKMKRIIWVIRRVKNMKNFYKLKNLLASQKANSISK